jgi:hypothetical protein
VTTLIILKGIILPSSEIPFDSHSPSAQSIEGEPAKRSLHKSDALHGNEFTRFFAFDWSLTFHPPFSVNENG